MEGRFVPSATAGPQRTLRACSLLRLVASFFRAAGRARMTTLAAARRVGGVPEACRDGCFA